MASIPANLDTAQGNRNPETDLHLEHPGFVKGVSPNHGPGEHELKLLRIEGEADTNPDPVECGKYHSGDRRSESTWEAATMWSSVVGSGLQVVEGESRGTEAGEPPEPKVTCRFL